MLVIGAGPAGMEAARAAAEHGHRVTLYEKQPCLGGALTIAAIPPGKEKINWIAEYYAHELPRLGVDIHLGEALEPDGVQALEPDVVIIATGSDFTAPDIPGTHNSNVLTAQSILAKRTHFTEQACVVIGGGMLGLETAEYLAANGNTVTVLKRYETIGRNIEPMYREYLLRKLEELGVELKTKIQVKMIQRDGVLIQDISGEEYRVPAHWVVLARGAAASNGLARALKGFNPVVIGDALQPRKIIDAIKEGYEAARSIERNRSSEEN